MTELQLNLIESAWAAKDAATKTLRRVVRHTATVEAYKVDYAVAQRNWTEARDGGVPTSELPPIMFKVK
jgi:hypothetical protein